MVLLSEAQETGRGDDQAAGEVGVGNYGERYRGFGKRVYEEGRVW